MMLITLSILLFFPYILLKIKADEVPESELYSRLGWFIILYVLFAHYGYSWVLALLIMFFIASLVDVLYAQFFSATVIPSSIEAIFLTNTTEAFEFVDTYLNWKKLFIPLFYTISFIGSIYLAKLPSDVANWLEYLAIFLAVYVAFNIIIKKNFKGVLPGFLGMLPTYLMEKQLTDRLIQQRLRQRDNLPKELITFNEDKEHTVVLVIGESATRNHHGIYGYTRQTTPFIDARRNKICLAKNMISDFVQTNPSLSSFLTLDKTSVDSSLSLVDIYRAAGYETWWISSQEPSKSTPSAIAKTSDNVYFVETDMKVNSLYDEVLLDKYIQALNSPAKNKLIVLHLLGSHFKYRLRYPPEYNYFKNRNGIKAYKDTNKLSDKQVKIINEYDNSIRYTDYILDRLIGLLDKKTALSCLTYLSDHGEEVFDSRNFKGHEPSNFSKSMFEIPFWVWFSDEYANDNIDLCQQLEENFNKPLALVDFIHFFANLGKLQTDLIKDKCNWASQNFTIKTRTVYTIDFDKI